MHVRVVRWPHVRRWWRGAPGGWKATAGVVGVGDQGSVVDQLDRGAVIAGLGVIVCTRWPRWLAGRQVTLVKPRCREYWRQVSGDLQPLVRRGCRFAEEVVALF